MNDTQQTHIDSLRTILGQTFKLYIQTHGYHWNVEGPDFRQLHTLFEAHYTDLWTALDEIAELIRVRGAYAPGSIADFAALAGVEAAAAQSADDMIANLVVGHEGLADTLRRGIQSAGDAGDEVAAGYLTDRLAWHEKELWMMKAARA